MRAAASGSESGVKPFFCWAVSNELPVAAGMLSSRNDVLKYTYRISNTRIMYYDFYVLHF